MKINMKKTVLVLMTASLTACVGKQLPVTPDEQHAVSLAEMERVFNFRPDRVLGLQDVIGYTMTRNQDVITKNFELEISRGEKLFANLGYLPTLEASLRDTRRDSLLLTTSERLGQPPIEGVDTIPSFSAPQDVRNESVAIKWDLLNVAKNYLTVKQKANEEYIAKNNRERTAQNIFRDIYPAYSLSTINQHEGKQLKALSAKLKFALDKRCSVFGGGGAINGNDALATNCMSALSSINNVKDLLSSLRSAELNLHALMSVPSDHEILLEKPRFTDPGAIQMDLDELLDYAIANRPELGVEIYRERIAKLDKQKAKIDILPSVEFGYTYNETDNPFVVNQEFEESSFNVTWNLISKVIGTPLRIRQADRQAQLAKSRYRALLITILTQTELAHSEFITAREKWINSYQKHKIQAKIQLRNRSKYEAGAISEIEHYKNEIDAVLSQMQVSADYGRMIDGLSMLYLSIGIPVTPNLDITDPSRLVDLIAARLRELSILS